MDLELTSNSAKWKDENLIVTGIDILGEKSFHLITNKGYKYFSLSDVTINGENIELVSDLINEIDINIVQ